MRKFAGGRACASGAAADADRRTGRPMGMPRTAAAGFRSLVRSSARRRSRGPSWLAAFLILFGLTLSNARAAPDLVKGEATFAAADGYARLVFKLAADVGTEVTTAGSILIIRFNRPVDIPVDKLSEAAPDY